MKKLLLVFCMLSFMVGTYAQRDSSMNCSHGDDIRTIFGNIESKGGYMAFTVKYSEIANQYNWDFGGRAGWILNHNIALGFAGYGFMKEPKFDTELNDKYNLQGGYGGFLIEPILLPRFPVHISIPVLIGAGGVSYTLSKQMMGNSNAWNGYYDTKDYIIESQPFAIIEPGVELEFNIVRYFRISFGAYYRYTTNINIRNNTSTVLNGFSGGITFKLGKF